VRKPPSCIIGAATSCGVAMLWYSATIHIHNWMAAVSNGAECNVEGTWLAAALAGMMVVLIAVLLVALAVGIAKHLQGE